MRIIRIQILITLLVLLVTGTNTYAFRAQGKNPDDFGYSLKPDDSSASASPVGSTVLNTDVSPTGAATFNIPLTIAPGHGLIQPEISIAYNSQSNNGVAGFGCGITGLSVISRVPGDIYHDGKATGLKYDSGDMLSIDGQRLMLISGAQGQEGSVYRIESDPKTEIVIKDGDYGLYFEVTTADGRCVTYGNTYQSRQRVWNGEIVCSAWYADHAEDVLGNFADYEYTQDNNTVYISRIIYGKNKNVKSLQIPNVIDFSYEARPDRQKYFIEQTAAEMALRLKSVVTRRRGYVLRKYILGYNDTADMSATKFSRLVSVTEENEAGEQLNPSRIIWTALPSHAQSANEPDVTLSTSMFVHKGQQNFMSTDINGDGISDIIEMCPVIVGPSQQSGSVDNYCYIYPSVLNADGSISFSSGQEFSLGPDIVFDDWNDRQGSPLTADITGDGMPELIIPNITVIDEMGVKRATFQFICGSKDGGRRNMNAFVCVMKKSKELPLYTAADFDNDGKSEIVVVEREPVSGKSYNLIRIYNSGGYSLLHTESEITLEGKPGRLFSADFNNDGLNDIIFLYDDGYKAFLNNGDLYKFNDANAIEGTTLKNSVRVEPGDFNGDGVLDFLTYDSGAFTLAIGEGDGRFSAVSLGKISNISGHDENDSRFSMVVYDFDHDGKSDVVISALQGQATVYWIRSTGESLELVKTATSNRKDDVLASRFIVGDFDGDGMSELMNYGFNCYSSTNADTEPTLRFYTNATVASGKVRYVTDGYGNRTIFSYKSLANDKNVYTPGSGAAFPVIDLTLPLHVVSKVTSENGSVADDVTTYRYSGLKVHTQGRGLLGLSGMTVKNETTGRTITTSVSQWDPNFFIPTVTTQTETSGSSVATTVVTRKIADKGNKTFFAYTWKESVTDFDGDTSVKEYFYDTDICQPTMERTEYDAGAAYQSVSYGDYVKKGGVWLPQTVSETIKYSDDVPEKTTVTSISYNDNGLKSSVIENYGSSLPLTTEYFYDVWGNPLYSLQKENTTGRYTYHNVYDSYGDNIIEKYNGLILKLTPGSKIIQPIKNKEDIKTFTYDTQGNLLTESDETVSDNILTTHHYYDGWGNRIKTVSPEGNVATSETGWGTSFAKKYYVLEQRAGEPWVKTWYDSRGREVLVESVGPMDVPVTKKTEYNDRGMAETQINSIGVLAVRETFKYDERGRITEYDNNKGDKKNFSYGRRTQTVTDGNGRTTIKEYDAWGNVVSSSVNGITVEYEYGSSGQPVKVRTCGTETNIGYDDVGNRISLTDPNTGTATYKYDALGRETERIDARGKTTTTVYDGLDRISSVVSDGTETLYTYGKEGYSALRLIKEQTGNNSISYEHDQYGRVTAERRIIGETTLDFSYVYDDKGLLTRTVYPGDIVADYKYDSYGNRIAIIVDNDTVWKLKKYTGRVTYHAFGRDITSKEIRSAQNGKISELSVYNGVENIFYMPLVYDKATGNLMSRANMFPLVKENFSYDGFDRLLGVKSSIFISRVPAYDDDGKDLPDFPVIPPDVSLQNDDYESIIKLPPLCDCTYSSNGNITSKSGLGEYVYDSGKPHAVSMVDNTDGLISCYDQYAEYNGEGKIKILSEGGYVMDFSYGPDGERWQTVLSLDGNVKRTTLYAGDYERIISNDTIREFYYIGNGVLYVRETGKADRILYQITDNLGSILRIIDSDGNAVFDASYDAWGKQTLRKNEIGYNRGYTGHEMMPEFGFVNMNGRLYDPLLGRFLSPDNYVQLPDNSQSYNRYSYCLNNPLKYTDPSGELFGIDDLLIGAVISGIMNLAMNIPNISSFWKGLGFFGIGAFSTALTMGVGSGVSSLLGGGSFMTGFIGKSTFMAGHSFMSGLIVGGTTGFAAGFINSFGNGLLNGLGFNSSLKNGLDNGITGGIFSGLTNGIIGGLEAIKHDANFWNGKRTVFLSDFAANGKNGHIKTLMNKGLNKLSAKYIGEFENASVYESPILGNYPAEYSGITLPPVGIFVGQGVYAGDLDFIRHEFGHILQYKKYGLYTYYKVFAKESIISASIHTEKEHNIFWTETYANYLSYNYLKPKITNNLIKGWNFQEYPIRNISKQKFYNILLNTILP